MKKNIAILIFVLILMLLTLQSQGLLPSKNDENFAKEVANKDVTFIDKSSSVRMLSAQIRKSGDSHYLDGEIVNASDIPVTLVEMNISCGEEDKVFIIAHEKDEKLNRVVPIKISIGEKYKFNIEVGNVDILDSCSIGVKSWGKYGVKE